MVRNVQVFWLRWVVGVMMIVGVLGSLWSLILDGLDGEALQMVSFLLLVVAVYGRVELSDLIYARVQLIKMSQEPKDWVQVPLRGEKDA